MNLKSNLDDEIKWRIGELALIKTNHKSRNISMERRNVILKYSVVSIYALLEGFVVKAFDLFFSEINKRHHDKNEFEISIVGDYLDREMNLFNERKATNSKYKLVKSLESFFYKENLLLKGKVEANGNINLKVLNKLFNTYNINSNDLENKKIEKGLNKLLKFRNSIAHGEIGLKVEDSNIFEFIDVVTETMDIISDNIQTCYINKKYLRKPGQL